MTDYEAGYLQALKDVQGAVGQMVSDHGTSPDGKIEMLDVESFLDSLIKTKVKRHQEHNIQDAADLIGGSF